MKILLLLITLFVGLTSVAGGAGLIVSNGLGLPISYLWGSVFSSYFWPGMILAVVVGGTYLLAFWHILKKSSLRFYASATAGFGLLIWLFVEMYIIPQHHCLQTLYFVLALMTLILTMLLLERKVKS